MSAAARKAGIVGASWRAIAGVVLGLMIVPAFAQGVAGNPFDVTGVWVPAGGGPTFFGGSGFQEDADEREHGPALVDYAGVPLNAAGRARALSYDGALLGVPEHQCMPHPATYSFWGPPDTPAGGPRISSEVDDSGAVVAYHVEGMFRRADRTIWMDGRAHPSEHAAHTWAGFTTGRWEGAVLVTRTTHLKWSWIRRNGVIVSDLATVVTRYARHGDVLTLTVIVNDPVYLSEPFIRTIDFIPWSASPARQGGGGESGIPSGIFTECYPNEEVGSDSDEIPHYLPWANPFVREEEERHGLPPGAVLGGAETMYPEYRQTAGRRTAPPSPVTQRNDRPESTGASVTGIEVLPVQGNVWMLASQGVNLAFQVGDDGVVLVDTGIAGNADAILAAIRGVTDKPIRYIINTSAAADRAGNNGIIASLPGGDTSGTGRGATPAVIAHEQVLTRMTAGDAGAFPDRGWPTDAYLFRKRSLYFNGEAIDIIHQPSAYSDGDSIVHFRRSDVIVAGSLLTTTYLPRFDADMGGSYQGLLDSLNAMLDIAVPEVMQEGGTYIVPGRGRICDEADLAEIRDQAQMIRDRFVDLVVEKKRDFQGMRDAHPLVDFERRYEHPDWTTEQFSLSLYREISEQR